MSRRLPPYEPTADGLAYACACGEPAGDILGRSPLRLSAPRWDVCPRCGTRSALRAAYVRLRLAAQDNAAERCHIKMWRR